MQQTTTGAETPRCPGCHFGCPLDAYRCARGKGFGDRWRAGEPVPERGVPPMLRKGAGKPPAAVRVMHGLNIMANVLQERHTESAERKVLASISRQGGFFATSLLGKRTLIEQPQLDGAIAALCDAGLAELVDEPVAGQVVRITEEGRARQVEWDAEHEEANAKFLEPLSEDEQEQLAEFIFRLLHP